MAAPIIAGLLVAPSAFGRRGAADPRDSRRAARDKMLRFDEDYRISPGPRPRRMGSNPISTSTRRGPERGS